jgi:fructosamine-3-kinase
VSRQAALRARIEAELPTPVRRLCPIGGGSVCAAHRADLSDGGSVFVKSRPDAPHGFFAAEARGLRLLAAALLPAALLTDPQFTDVLSGEDAARGFGTRVPRVLAVREDLLIMEWVDPGSATQQGAELLGSALATLHRTPAERFGTELPAFIGPLPLPLSDKPFRDALNWPEFHTEYRLLPALRQAVDAGGLEAEDARAVEQVCGRLPELAGPPQAPAVVHGDLWSGNVHWGRTGTPWLIDPCAQGGHPEADLAMLRLFGMPQLLRTMAVYDEMSPPLPGREARVPLHQLHPLLVHTVLFGGGYGAEAGRCARRALAA